MRARRRGARGGITAEACGAGSGGIPLGSGGGVRFRHGLIAIAVIAAGCACGALYVVSRTAWAAAVEGYFIGRHPIYRGGLIGPLIKRLRLRASRSVLGCGVFWASGFRGGVSSPHFVAGPLGTPFIARTASGIPSGRGSCLNSSTWGGIPAKGAPNLGGLRIIKVISKDEVL